MWPRRFLVLASLLTVGFWVQAQQPAPKPPDKPGPFKKDVRLETEKPTDADFRLFRALVGGRERADNAAARQVLDKMSKWLVYRLTWLEIQESRDGSIGLLMAEIFGSNQVFPIIGTSPDADSDELARRVIQRVFVRELRVAMVPHLRKVLEVDQLVARVNAMRILHKFAELAQEEVVDDFVRALDHPYEVDAVRHWAIKGLGEIFRHQASDPTFGKSGQPPERVQRAEAGANAICRWLQAHIQVPPTLLAEMSDDEKNGVRYVRREAVRALANIRRAWAVEKNNQGQFVREGPIADLLVKIMSADEGTVLPEPSWHERVEAAHALCLIQIVPGTNYQPDFMAQSFGRFLAQLVQAANDDRSRQQERWKFFGAHLRHGAENLKTNIAAAPQGVLQPAAVAYINKFLAQIEANFANLSDAEKEQQAAQNMQSWLNDNRSPNQQTYKGNAPADK